MSTTTQSGTPATLPAGVVLALDVVGTPAAPTTGDGIPYSKLDIGIAGVSSPVTAVNPLPVTSASLPLPTGASTSVAQATGNASLVSLDTKTPALGQALAAAAVPVVLTAIQQTALTPPAAITGYALEAGHLATIDTSTAKIPAQGQALAAASMPVVLPAAQITTLTPPAAITGFATETTLAGRLKPADTLTGVTTVGTVTTITNAVTVAQPTAASLNATTTPATPAASANTHLNVSLGSTTGKAAVLKTGSLVTTATTADQVVLTYTVTAGKTLYLQYISLQGRLTTPAATASVLGALSVETPSGTKVYTIDLVNPTTSALDVFTVPIDEPVPIAAAAVIRVVVTPAAATSMTWKASLGGYER